MPFTVADISPIARLDREQALMRRLIEQSLTGPDTNPQHQTSILLGALGNTIGLIGPNCPADMAADPAVLANLCALLVTGASLARQFDVVLYDGDVWPDDCDTRIGGDGALATGHDVQTLLGELLEAAGWVGTWVHACTTTASARMESGWQATVPITEFIARALCLADRLGVRAQLCILINEHLSGQGTEQTRSGTG